MGRVSRYKKIKAFDPFSRTGGFVDLDKGKVFDLAPKPRHLDALPKGVALLVSAQGLAAGRGGVGRRDKGGEGAAPRPPSTARLFSHIHALPGESLKSFNRRVTIEQHKRQAEARAAPVEGSQLSEKRQRFLEDRRQRKRQRGGQGGDGGGGDDDAGGGVGGGGPRKRARGDGDDGAARDASRAPDRPMDFPTAETVAFGERAMAPPRLSVAPRKSQVRCRARRREGRRISSNRDRCTEPQAGRRVVVSSGLPRVVAPPAVDDAPACLRVALVDASQRSASQPLACLSASPYALPSQKQKARAAAEAQARAAVRTAAGGGATPAQTAAAQAAAAMLSSARADQVAAAQMEAYKGQVVAAYKDLKRRRADAAADRT